jgi:D-arabinose 1-dehydrogenase-like Zn-dependent alcohol dehydrogenase
MSIPSTMKAVVLHSADDMRLEALPVPEPGPGEVLLKVEVASICGTDASSRGVRSYIPTIRGRLAPEMSECKT